MTLIVIVGFQAYWLNDNYNRENRTMQIKTGVAFQETVQQLQAIKLKIPATFMRSSTRNESENILLETEDNKNRDTSVKLRQGIIKTVNLFRKKLNYLAMDSSGKNPFLITIRNDSGEVVKRIPLRHNEKYSSGGKEEIFIEEGLRQNGNGNTKHGQIITMVNTIHSGFKDSVLVDSFTPNMVIRVRKDSNHKSGKTSFVSIKKDIDHKNILKGLSDSSRHAFSLLYSVDSLQDSLRLSEIVKAYSETLGKQNINVPFTVEKSDSAEFREAQDFSEVTVGFANPATYRLILGNTTGYLIKKISLPILFSFFLVGVTIFSFVLLYRSLIRQQKLAEIKNEFISNITHELKTPIATVGVAIEALKNFNAIHDPQKTKEYLEISGNELQRLGLLVDKVLRLSMFEKREVELSCENFDTKELTLEVLDTMKLQFDKNNALLHFTSGGDNFTVNADKLHITSVIYNLLDNALKYRSEIPVIDVNLSAQQNSIVLSITDNGIGIAPEYQAKIFDKFFRVPTGNRHVVKGYGLGLSYVSHIIERHHGSIRLESVIGKGSTFSIKIPVNG